MVKSLSGNGILSFMFALVCPMMFYLERFQLRSIMGGQDDWKDESSSSSSSLKSTPATRIESPHRRPCSQNPYVHGLADSLENITQHMDALLQPAAVQATLQALSAVEHWKSKPKLRQRHMFSPFNSMAACKESERVCVGGHCGVDQSKITCGLSSLQPGCVVYSIGSNNQWDFEIDLLEKTPCDVHTFDCTGPASRFVPPDHPRLHFHHICLGAHHQVGLNETKPCPPKKGRSFPGKCGPTWTLLEMQQYLGHEQIDLHKMDMEAWEWVLLESWPELLATTTEQPTLSNPIDNSNKDNAVPALPMQLLLELHLWRPDKPRGQNGVNYTQVVDFQQHLLRMGYVVVERDDNPRCPNCSELTLMRTRCPAAAT